MISSSVRETFSFRSRPRGGPEEPSPTTSTAKEKSHEDVAKNILKVRGVTKVRPLEPPTAEITLNSRMSVAIVLSLFICIRKDFMFL